MIDMIELEQCPFCGDTAFLSEYTYELDSCHVIMHFVECNGCHATTYEYDSEEEAAEAWNRRIDND
jgi:Lar family restriction alleviation protein